MRFGHAFRGSRAFYRPYRYGYRGGWPLWGGGVLDVGSDMSSDDGQQNIAGELPNLPTDFAPSPVIDARYTQAVKRGDRAHWQVVPITVPYDSKFDVFAARAAYALRDRLYYRHDNGRNARGLVRATGDLQLIHKLYATGTPPPNSGTPIQLNAILGRRQDPRAKMRWVMVIRFNDSHGWGFVDVDASDADVVTADPEALKKKTMAEVLKLARMDCVTLPSNHGKRICEMISIAERLGYPKNWDLWYYERGLVDKYVQFHTNNAERKQMTQATRGKLPFDGQGNAWGGEWRMRPFQQATIDCSRGKFNCKARVHNILVHAEDEMFRTFQDIDKYVLSRDAASAFGPLVEDFIKHLNSLLNDPDSLYSAFKKFPK